MIAMMELSLDVGPRANLSFRVVWRQRVSYYRAAPAPQGCWAPPRVLWPRGARSQTQQQFAVRKSTPPLQPQLPPPSNPASLPKGSAKGCARDRCRWPYERESLGRMFRLSDGLNFQASRNLLATKTCCA